MNSPEVEADSSDHIYKLNNTAASSSILSRTPQRLSHAEMDEPVCVSPLLDSLERPDSLRVHSEHSKGTNSVTSPETSVPLSDEDEENTEPTISQTKNLDNERAPRSRFPLTTYAIIGCYVTGIALSFVV